LFRIVDEVDDEVDDEDEDEEDDDDDDDEDELMFEVDEFKKLVKLTIGAIFSK